MCSAAASSVTSFQPTSKMSHFSLARSIRTNGDRLQDTTKLAEIQVLIARSEPERLGKNAGRSARRSETAKFEEEALAHPFDRRRLGRGCNELEAALYEIGGRSIENAGMVDSRARFSNSETRWLGATPLSLSLVRDLLDQAETAIGILLATCRRSTIFFGEGPDGTSSSPRRRHHLPSFQRSIVCRRKRPNICHEKKMAPLTATLSASPR